MSDTFPRQYARTQRLTLGEPRTFTVAPDGLRIVFARSDSGSDGVNSLWVLDTTTGQERRVLDPRTIGTDLAHLTPEELRRRERAREGAGGVVTYACDSSARSAVTVLGGHIVHVDLDTGEVTVPAIEPGVFDVRLSPDGALISFVRGDALCIADLAGNERVLAADNSETVTWGAAEFIAAEEMGRFRGYWWSPDSTHIIACRADLADVPTWWIADPAHPESPAQAHRYPAAGSTNASVSLHVINVKTAVRVDVSLSVDHEYINSVTWNDGGLIAQTQSRDQRRIDIHLIEPTDGSSRILWSDTDDAWVELVPGAPAILEDGRIVTCADRDGARRLMVDGAPVTAADVQVRSLIHAADTCLITCNPITTPWVTQVRTVDLPTGTTSILGIADGVVSASGTARCAVLRSSSLESDGATFTVVGTSQPLTIASHAETPLVNPQVRIVAVGPRAIPVAIVTPRDGQHDKLPVLFDPYGGPHAQRVVASRAAYLSSQWFADHGFIVVIVDGVGTPGKGSEWERAVHHDLAKVVLDDQVEIVRDLPDLEPRADTSRVGIRGWSFGGYLAALAVLRRSDLFHAAVAGAPVTDWSLYDTHYTERYLGTPRDNPTVYESTSLLNDVDGLESPLLIVHGLADDNVVAAHTLQLSSALLAAGKSHEVLPLSGVTHMTPQEVVAENLLLHQLAFLQRALG